MNRRGFLRLLGGAVAAAAAPTKAYSFLGGILRPRREIVWPNWEWSVGPPIVLWRINANTWAMLKKQIEERVAHEAIYGSGR